MTTRRRLRGDLVLAVALLAFAAWAIWREESPRRAPAYDERADWSAPSGRQANFSTYAYRDRNRDGALDLGDRPFAAIAVEMTASNFRLFGRQVTRLSNLNGFVNFPAAASWLHLGALIRRPGVYRFRTLAPPGWSVSSKNQEQESEFVSLPGSLSDVVSRNPTTPVGLVAELTISGRVATADGAAAGGLALVAVSPDGTSRSEPLSPDGRFTIAATPGIWRLEARCDGFATLVREIEVRDAPVRLATLAVGEAELAPAPFPQTIDFEGFSTLSVAKIPNGVAALEWSQLNAIDLLFAAGPGYTNTSVSGRLVAYSSTGHPVTISSSKPFDFRGGYFGVGWPDAEGETLIATAWRGSQRIGEERIRLSAFGPVDFVADWRGLDRVELMTEHRWQFAVDDLRVATPDPPPPAAELP